MCNIQDYNKLLELLKCPITGNLMIDPVTTSTGHTYERSAIEEIFRTKQTTTDVLIPNIMIKFITQFIKQYVNNIQHRNDDKTREILMQERRRVLAEVEHYSW